MKASHVIAAIVIAATPALANAAAGRDTKTLAVYTGISVNNGDNGPRTLADATLMEDGTLVIEKHTFGGQFGTEPMQTQTLVSELGASTFEALKEKIEQVSDATIKTDSHRFVCMMMPLFGSVHELKLIRSYNYDTKTFTGDVVLVDTGAGCWRASVTQFADAYAQNIAHEIEGSLETLTLEALR